MVSATDPGISPLSDLYMNAICLDYEANEKWNLTVWRTVLTNWIDSRSEWIVRQDLQLVRVRAWARWGEQTMPADVAAVVDSPEFKSLRMNASIRLRGKCLPSACEDCHGSRSPAIAAVGEEAKDDYLNPTIRNAKAIVRSTTRQR
jgi:hypothetical protein